MAALPALIPRYTIRDLECWEDRWELIEGIPHAMSPAPAIRHQFISQKIAALLLDALADCPACVSLLAGNWRIDEDTVVIPDHLVVCPSGALEGVYLTEAPAFIVEILSPSTALKDRTVKRELYAQQGVRHYLLVDPDTETTEVLELRDGRYVRRHEGRDGTLSFDLESCSLSLDLGRFWP